MTTAALIIALIACMVSVFTLGLVLAPHFIKAPERAETASQRAEDPEGDKYIKEARKKAKAEAEAFEELMSYSADVAYGMKDITNE